MQCGSWAEFAQLYATESARAACSSRPMSTADLERDRAVPSTARGARDRAARQGRARDRRRVGRARGQDARRRRAVHRPGCGAQAADPQLSSSRGWKRIGEPDFDVRRRLSKLRRRCPPSRVLGALPPEEATSKAAAGADAAAQAARSAMRTHSGAPSPPRVPTRPKAGGRGASRRAT